MNIQVSLCLFGVNDVKVKKKKRRYYIVLERAQGPPLLDCNYADTCFTVARGRPCWWLHRFHTEPHYTDRLQALVLREDLKSVVHSLLVLCYFQKLLENRRNLVEHISYEMHLDLPVNSHTG